MSCMALAGTDNYFLFFFFLLLFDFLSFFSLLFHLHYRLPGYVPWFKICIRYTNVCSTSYLGTYDLQVPGSTNSLQVLHLMTCPKLPVSIIPTSSAPWARHSAISLSLSLQVSPLVSSARESAHAFGCASCPRTVTHE